MIRRRLLTGKGFLALPAVLLLAFAGLIATPSAAVAADARDFNAGNIISDENFYNGYAMSAPEVQTFLNQRVPRCTIGDPGRTAGMAWGNTVIASKCLRDYAMNTITRPANSYCGAYVGRTGETAAEIITKVGQACGISQKVLLITLEKEQSLVSDSWPTVRQIDVATGYACPDSGPGWSANCNPEYYGFQNQVYYAAWQLKVYRAFPGSYNYKPFQWNTIQYNPDPSCGSSQVYIQNWATAALYIYTPYQPNQAALNAQWGTGDECSTYGNRNFFMLYSSWFENPLAPSVPGQSQIDAAYARNTWLGAPTTGYNRNESWGEGTVRGYAEGVITWTPSTGAKILSYQIRTYHREAGGLIGWLGWPTTESTNHGSGRWVQGFQGGAVLIVPGYGTFGLKGDIRTSYLAHGGLSGPLGWPVNDEWQVNSQGYTVQGFQNAAIAKSVYGTYVLTGDIRRVFNLNGGLNGPLGWPLNDEWQVNSQGYTVQGFQNAAIAKSVYGTYVLTGDIRRVFNLNGGLNGPLGWPLNSEWQVNSRGDTLQGFAGGAIARSSYGTFVLSGEIRTMLNANGGLNGILGWPTSDITCTGFECSQNFEGGIVFWNEQTRTSRIDPVNSQPRGLAAPEDAPATDPVAPETPESDQVPSPPVPPVQSPPTPTGEE